MNRKKTLMRLLSFLRPSLWIFFLSLLFAAVSVGLTLYAPIVIGQAVDLIVSPNHVLFQPLFSLLVQLVVLIALIGVCQWIFGLCNNLLVCRISNGLRKQAFGRLHCVSVGQVDSFSKGDIISRITTDIDQISDGLLLGFSQLLTGVATILGTLGFMLSLNVKIALIVVLLTPFSFFVANFIAKHTFHYFQQQAKVRGEMTALTEEMLSNQKTVQAFCYESQSLQRFEEINLKMKDCGQKAVFFSSLTNPCTRFVNGLVYAAVGIAGAFAALSGSITVGGLSAFLSYANQYTKPFNEISGVVTELQNALASAARVFSLIDTPAEPTDCTQTAFPEKAEGAVVLDSLSFSYTPQKPLLKNLNLAVSSGQHIAIVGPTGCGKTTLINLFMRFYEPNSGRILLDGTDIHTIPRNHLRAQWGMVLQDTWLTNGTVAENIAYGKPNATQQEIETAAKAAFAHGFILRLPSGYQTVLGEGEAELSAGQKQLLCIARVMLQQPSMLILDEATSNIDTRTEQKVQRAFDALMQGRTCFVVAHRLSTIQNADLILVMKDGNITEQGTHTELLQQNGFYSTLYNSRFAAPAE